MFNYVKHMDLSYRLRRQSTNEGKAEKRQP